MAANPGRRLALFSALLTTTWLIAPVTSFALPSARSGAPVGATLTLSGLNGEKLAVTLTKVVDPAKPADEYNAPPTGDRLVATQFRIVNIGSVDFDDAIDNDVQLVDDAGQGYTAAYETVAGGQSFPVVRILPGDDRLGYVVFEVPARSRLAEVQFVPDSGFSDDTGQWAVTSVAAQPPAKPAPPAATPADVVRAYYDAINAHDYREAWNLGGKNFGGSYAAFAAGFSDTLNDAITVNSTTGDVVNVSLDAEQNDGSFRDYSGTYTVRNGLIVAAHLKRD